MTLVRERPSSRIADPEVAHRSAVANGPLRAVLLALPFVAVAELVLMRTFYRVGIFIPKEGPFRTVYAVLTEVGSFAFNLASVLALAALGLLAVAAFRRRHVNLGIALAVFLLSVLGARAAGADAVGPVPRLSFALVLVAVVVPFLRSGADVVHRVMVVAVGSSLALSTYGAIAQGAGIGGAPGAPGAQIAAELLVVVAAATSLAAWLRTERFRLRPPLVAAPLAASFLAAWTANGSVTGILVLWTVGLRLYLAPWVYAIALWAFLAAAIGWLRPHPWRGMGLVLLLTAGLLLGSTYQQAVGLLAIVLLTDGAAFGGLPPCVSRARSRSRSSPALRETLAARQGVEAMS